MKSFEIDDTSIAFEESAGIPKVGQYVVTANYKEFFIPKSKTISVIISDTTKPEFITYPEIVRLTTMDKDHDFASYFEIKDLSEVNLNLDSTSINFEQPGEYTLKATALDIYGNKATKEILVLVEESPTEIMALSSSQDAYGTNQAKDSEILSTTASKNSSNSPLVSPAPKSEEPLNDLTPKEPTPKIVRGILVVNKKYPIPTNYSLGEDPTAAAKCKKLIAEMRSLGYDISNSYSGYRTYDYQKKLYNRYVNADGKKLADTYSARPGHSEHQTGLAYDLKHNDGTLAELTKETQWIKENASRYGFIVRYLEGKESITGYQAEPWHLRYIGDEAIKIDESALTLEEYLNVEGGDYN